MNSCILMVEIYDVPQLRHTPDGLEITEMIVQIPGLRPDDPSHPLKVVSWGNLAKEIHQTYNSGDRVIIEGRLGMNTVDRPEGFKEKRAELTVQRIYPINQNLQTSQTVSTTAPPPVEYSSSTYQPSELVSTPAPTPATTTTVPQQPTPEPTYQPIGEPDPDDIPF